MDDVEFPKFGFRPGWTTWWREDRQLVFAMLAATLVILPLVAVAPFFRSPPLPGPAVKTVVVQHRTEKEEKERKIFAKVDPTASDRKHGGKQDPPPGAGRPQGRARDGTQGRPVPSPAGLAGPVQGKGPGADPCSAIRDAGLTKEAYLALRAQGRSAEEVARRFKVATAVLEACLGQRPPSLLDRLGAAGAVGQVGPLEAGGTGNGTGFDAGTGGDGKGSSLHGTGLGGTGAGFPGGGGTGPAPAPLRVAIPDPTRRAEPPVNEIDGGAGRLRPGRTANPEPGAETARR